MSLQDLQNIQVIQRLQNIAQYTFNDSALTSLKKWGTIQADYAYYLFSYPDPNSNQQMTAGLAALNDASSAFGTNPTNFLATFKNPKKFNNMMTMIAVLICILTIIAFIVAMFVTLILKKHGKYNLFLVCGPAFFGMLMVIVILNLFYKSIVKEIMRAYVMLTSSPQSQCTSQETPKETSS